MQCFGQKKETEFCSGKKSLEPLTVNQTELGSLKFDVEVQHYQISFRTVGNIQKKKKTVTYDIVSSYPSVFLCC